MASNREDARPNRVAYALNKIVGMAQEEIARRAGVSFSTVNAWVNGKRQPRGRSRKSLDVLWEEATHQPVSEDARVRAIVARLHVAYGSPQLGNKDDPLDELFFILLSLKTSHHTYEDTYEHFRAQFYPWDKLLDVAAEEVEQHIRRGGLGSLKARSFVDIARRLKEDFGSVSLAALCEMGPSEAEAYLTSLPGVGVKTARCVLMYSLGLDVVPVDTHTYRVGARLEVVPTSRSTKQVHGLFDAATPAGIAHALHTNFVAHGRAICQDPTPKCDTCVVRDLCPYPARRARADPLPESRGARARQHRRRADDGAFVAADIYAGCGGLSWGLQEGGFDVRYALDWDANACATHEGNFPGAVVDCRDVRSVSGQRIRDAVGGRLDLLAGGPNCQGVSQRGLRNPDDPRNFMLPEFVRLVSELRPRAFVMENVPGLAHRHNYQFLRSIFESFQSLGYRCAADVLLAASFGVPQLRYRFFLVGVLGDLPLSFPIPTHQGTGRGDLFARPFVTVDEAIGDLPEIDAGQQEDGPLCYAGPAKNEFQVYVRHGSERIHNHVCSATAEINLARASYVPEGGNWKDIPPELLPPRLFTCRMTDHSTTYARLRRDQPAFTITSLFGNITAGAFTHPTTTRALSVREGARLQSFRDCFHFAGARNSQYRQIGNAVPPLLGRAVGAHLRALLAGVPVVGTEPRITPRLLADRRAWDALPVLTPRFRPLFGTGTRWPRGWGPEPDRPQDMLDNNYSLRPEFVPSAARAERRKPPPVGKAAGVDENR